MPVQLNRTLTRQYRAEVPTYTLSIEDVGDRFALPPVPPRAIGKVWRSGSLPSCYRWWFTASPEAIAWYKERTGLNLPPFMSCHTRSEAVAFVIELLEESL